MRFDSWSVSILVLLVCHHAHFAAAFTGFNLPLLQETFAIIGKDMLKGVTKMLNTNDEFSFAADETLNNDETDQTLDEDLIDLDTGDVLDLGNQSKEFQLKDDVDSEVTSQVSSQNEDEFTDEQANAEWAGGGESASPLVEDILKQDEEEIDYAKTLAQTAVNVAARKLMKKLGDEFKGVWV